MGHRQTLKIAITGGAGQIARFLAPMIASGTVFGRNRRIDLRLLDVEPTMPALRAIKMELQDSAFPALDKITVTTDAEEAFYEAEWVVMIGGKPRGADMSRVDLIGVNGPIVREHARAMNKIAAPDVRTLVVVNPCNTLALIASTHAPKIPPNRFFAMMRLDENRAKSTLATRLGVPVKEIRKLAVWGNHSATMFPDALHATYADQAIARAPSDDYFVEEFVRTVQQRGDAVIKASGGRSSAQSAAKAAADSLISISSPTAADDWTSLGVVSDGAYDVPRGLFCGFPVMTNGIAWHIVRGIEHEPAAERLIAHSVDELRREAEAAKSLGLF